MTVHIRSVQSADADMWDAYVHSHPQAALYHLYGWRKVIEKTYGHKTYYLAAISTIQYPATSNQQPAIVGLLPLVHLKRFLFGNSLISMPFFDLGGILADNEEVEQELLRYAIKLGRQLKACTIELRHAEPIACINPTDPTNSSNSTNPINSIPVLTKSHKVRMSLNVLPSSEQLMTHLKPRLRTKIRKSLKEGLTSQIGGVELLNDFYKVFSTNMRDLGSPVHTKRLMQHVIEEFPGKAIIMVVSQRHRPMASSLTIGFKSTLESPWVSSMRKFSHLSPNTLLYWTMIELARNSGYSFFEFGRSSPEGGPYQFKKQWGPRETPLHWQYIALNGKPFVEQTFEKSRFEKAVHLWKKLPISVTKIIGPMIRKHIGL